MTKKEIVDDVAEMVKEKFKGEPSGHDWWHIYRVWQLAKRIAKKEKTDLFVVELSALLHDFTDFKFCKDEKKELEKIKKILLGYEVKEKTANNVCDIIKNVSYKGAKVKNSMKLYEGLIVQDADKLDAIGAVGIARVFSFGGSNNRLIHDSTIKPTLHRTFEQYKSNKSPSINHFYEKLLLLKDLMNTNTAKKIAQKRHKFMKAYLKRFFEEIEGKS